MKKERPLEVETRTKEQIDRGKAIRSGLILQYKDEVRWIIEQM